MTTFFAPELTWSEAVSIEVKIPVHSATISTPRPDQSMFCGSLSAVILTVLPLTINLLSLISTEPSNEP